MLNFEMVLTIEEHCGCFFGFRSIGLKTGALILHSYPPCFTGNVSTEDYAENTPGRLAQQTYLKVCAMEPLMIPAEKGEYLKCTLASSPSKFFGISSGIFLLASFRRGFRHEFVVFDASLVWGCGFVLNHSAFFMGSSGIF